MHRARRHLFAGDELTRKMIEHGIEPGDCFLNMSRHSNLDPKFYPNFLNAVLAQWTTLDERIGHHLEPMIRTLVQLMLWTERQSASVVSPSKKRQYFDILSAQLSDAERACLFLYCFHTPPPHLTAIINRYSFFEHLILKSDYVLNILSKQPDSPFRPQAFVRETS